MAERIIICVDFSFQQVQKFLEENQREAETGGGRRQEPEERLPFWAEEEQKRAEMGNMEGVGEQSRPEQPSSLEIPNFLRMDTLEESNGNSNNCTKETKPW